MSDYQQANTEYLALANHYASVLGLDPNGVHNGDWDAFRHAFVSAAFTRDFGAEVALVLGDLNELKGDVKHGQPANERNMYEWNNSVGRSIGLRNLSNAETAIRVHAALLRGDLIRTPLDPRQYPSTAAVDSSGSVGGGNGIDGSPGDDRYWLPDVVDHQNDVSTDGWTSTTAVDEDGTQYVVVYDQYGSLVEQYFITTDGDGNSHYEVYDGDGNFVDEYSVDSRSGIEDDEEESDSARAVLGAVAINVPTPRHSLPLVDWGASGSSTLSETLVHRLVSSLIQSSSAFGAPGSIEFRSGGDHLASILSAGPCNLSVQA
jgi:hypothetical protein